MQALIQSQKNKNLFKLSEVLDREPNCDEVKIKVEYVGICGTDLHAYLGHFDTNDIIDVMGHEFSGIIVEKGENVENFEIGDRVTSEHTFETCETCEYCINGNYHLCNSRESIGFEKSGAYSEYVHAREQYVHKIPDDVDLKSAALIEPLASILHSLDFVNIKPFHKILIIGPGPMGLLAGKVLKNFNCQIDIIGTETDKDRLEIAKKNGLNIIDNPIMNHYDKIFECSGSQGGINKAIEVIKKQGQIIQIGMNPSPIEVLFEKIAYKEIQLNGVFCHKWNSWENAIKMISDDQIKIQDLITSVLNIRNWKRGFDNLSKQNEIKVLLTFKEVNENEK